jgi:hypothetical protein
MPQQQAEALIAPILDELQYRGLKMFENALHVLYERDIPCTKTLRFRMETEFASRALKKSLEVGPDAKIVIYKIYIDTSIAPFCEETEVRASCEMYEVGDQCKPLHVKIRLGEKGKTKDVHLDFNKISKDGRAYEVLLHPDYKN